MYSKSINELISAFKKLPSVGQKSAERYVLYLLKSGKKDVSEMLLALKQLMANVKSCHSCWDFCDNDLCPICSSPTRDNSIICVLAEPSDVYSIEKTSQFKGKYFILRGLIDVDQENIRNTKIGLLIERIKKDTAIREVILALNPDMRGETTALYLERYLKKLNPDLKVTRLARGLPMGSDLQYADEITLGAAIRNRS